MLIATLASLASLVAAAPISTEPSLYTAASLESSILHRIIDEIALESPETYHFLYYTSVSMQISLEYCGFGPFSVLGDIDNQLTEASVAIYPPNHLSLILLLQDPAIANQVVYISCNDVVAKASAPMKNIVSMYIQHSKPMYLDEEYKKSQDEMPLQFFVGEFELLKEKFKNSKRLEFYSANWLTLLMGAINYKNDAVINDCMSYQPDLTLTDEWDRSALEHAIIRNNVHLTRKLLQMGADAHHDSFVVVDDDFNLWKTPFSLAVEHARHEIVEIFIDFGFQVDTRDSYERTGLMTAATTGDLMLAQYFLDKGANISLVDEMDYSPLMLACDYGNNEMIRLLLDNGANASFVTAYGETPFISAIREGIQRETLELLVEKGANILQSDENGINALMAAVLSNEVEITEWLVSIKYPLDQQSVEGRTAMIFAAIHGLEIMYDILLLSGANKSIKDKHGLTAQDYFLLRPENLNSAAATNYILSLGANPNVFHPDTHRNALMSRLLIAGQDKLHVIRALLDHGADPFLVSPEGISAYLMSVSFKDSVVQFMFDQIKKV